MQGGLLFAAGLLLGCSLHLVMKVEASFRLKVTSPSGSSFGSLSGTAILSEITEILSVTSPAPHLIGGGGGGPKNGFRFKAARLPNCELPITVVGKKADGSIVVYSGTVETAPIKPEDVAQGVVVEGDPSKLDKLINDLNGKDVKVVVISKTPGSGGGGKEERAILLVDKNTGKVLTADEAEKIVKDKIKTTSSTVKTVRPNCYPKCKELCKTQLALDMPTGELPPVTISSVNANASVNLRTKWDFKCGKDAFSGDVCGSNSCGRSGSCKTAASVNEIHYGMCTCSDKKLGPACQILTRSYTGTASQTIVTQHNAGSSIDLPQMLSLSFQFAGKCGNPDENLCTVVKVLSGKDQLVQVELGRVTEPVYTTATLPKSPTDGGKAVLYSDRYLQTMQWLDVSVSAMIVGGQIATTTLFCSIEQTPVCLERKATSPVGSNTLKLTDASVHLGGAFTGCFRRVRLNGRLVDLKTSIVSSLTKEGCAAQDTSCGGAGAAASCGANSVCYARVGSSPFVSEFCNCRCAANTRMALERISLPIKCHSKCSQDAPVINTGSGSLAWTMQDGSAIALPSSSYVSLVFYLRTGQASVPEMIRISAGVTVTVKIEDETLQCCVGSSCYKFLPLAVNDKRWHEVAVKLAHTHLVTRVDDHSMTHQLPGSPVTLSSGAQVTMKLPSSCISNLRLSDIYLPTSTADTTQDSSSRQVKLTAGSGVTSSSTCSIS